MSPKEQAERIENIEQKLYQIQIDALSKNDADHEKRLRALEETQTKFNFILYLVMGGGLVSLIDLAVLVFILVKTMTETH